MGGAGGDGGAKPERSGSGGGAAKGGKKSWQAPKGTRDFYPADLLRRRYIIDAWRRVSLRHGFEEIDGPTFEDAELYTVKSGEGILGELFGAYSGKDPSDAAQVRGGGPPPFALRPEFTPTLARMYAARARQLPQPTKWFCVSNFFRAERPQRGRLREFWQWNADLIGDATPDADLDSISCCAELLQDVGLSDNNAWVRVNNRKLLSAIVLKVAPKGELEAIVALVDRRLKLSEQAFDSEASALGFRGLDLRATLGQVASRLAENDLSGIRSQYPEAIELYDVLEKAVASGLRRWLVPDLNIARGLAYYTGTVFELIAEGERAVAGGGRYDKLIELFGGPPTPAVGFGMGDVVLTNLLDDRKLMPEGRELLEACSRPLPVRCDVFVVANESDAAQSKVVPVVAELRRGVESEKAKQGECTPWALDRYSVEPLHARRSYKATKNIGKLLEDASKCHARFAAIIENGETCTLKNLDSGEQVKEVPLGEIGRRVSRPGG